MTNVSKQQLTAEAQSQLQLQLARVFHGVTEDRSKKLFASLLTEAELLMLAKRLAIILLVHQKTPVVEIVRFVKVSDATVRALRTHYKEGKFQTLVQHCTSTSFDRVKFWQTFDFILRGGLPPRGRDRWRWLKDQQ
jgi:uncharacterized protein YerC